MKSSLGPVHHSQVGPKEDLLLLTQQDGMPSLSSLKLLKVQLPAQTRSCTTILILEPWTLYTSWLYVHARRRQYQAFSLMILHESPWGPKSILWGNPSLCPRHGHGRINTVVSSLESYDLWCFEEKVLLQNSGLGAANFVPFEWLLLVVVD